MKNIFALPASFTVPLVIILIGLVWAMVAIILKNLNSRDVVFSYSALCAAFAMFYLNISLGMKDEVKDYVIQTQAYLTKELVMGLDTAGEGSLFVVEQRRELSHALRAELQCMDIAIQLGTRFTENLEELNNATRFFYFNGIIGTMLASFPDWRMIEVSHRGLRQSDFNYSKEGAGDNTFIETERLDEILGNPARNYTLRNFPTIVDGLTLPPDTRIKVSEKGMEIENSFTLLELSISLAGSIKAGHPTGNLNVEWLPNINIRRVMKKQRSGNHEYDQYAAWADKLYEHLKKGFE
ncbi:hypothetical protein [Pseudomonas sp. PL-6]